MARRRLTGALAGAAALACLVSACSSGGGGTEPSFAPQQPFPGDGAGQAVPEGPPEPFSTDPGSSAPLTPTSSTPSSGKTGDSAVVATNLNSPVGIAVLPDKTALVGERATGRIVRVQPQAGQPVQTVRTLAVDSAGGGGLLDLALSPTYAEDQLIFAYLSTPSDNRVVDFTLNGPVTAVFTGIPRGPSGNAGRIVFGADGDLYIGTGDAGRSANSLDPHSLAGKVLRVSDIGKPAAGNPKAGSPIFASGFKQVDALCADPNTVWLFEAEARGLQVPDVVSLLIPGDSYGWPNGGIGMDQTLKFTPVIDQNPGGCTVDKGTFYLTSRDGQALLGAPLNDSTAQPTLGKFTAYLARKYGRLLSVVTAPDGSLWLTTSNRDGHGKPIADDERVLHIQPPSQSGHSPA